MKALISTLVSVVLSLSILHAQKSPVKFGDIPMEDMTMKMYDKDTSASAVILNDYGEAYISVTAGGAKLYFERHLRIKILKKEGLDWANISIPIYHQGTAEETITGLKAVTYNLENGKIIETKASKESILKEKRSSNYNVQKIVMPNVKEGSVIECSFKISSDFLTNFPNWTFQSEIPTRWSEYWAIIPDFFTYEKYLQGYVPVSVYEVKPRNQGDMNEKAHHWVSKNVPAFKAEPYMTSEDDYVSKMNFALAYINFPGQGTQEVMGSWQKLNDDLLKDEGFGRVIDKSGFLKDNVAGLIAGKTSNLEKTQAIYQYVTNTIEWDGTQDYYPGNLKKIVEQKKGTSGDINVLLASMLDKAGIPVEMVLLSTRDHGFIREQYPMTKQFNYIVVKAQVDDKSILLDGTEKYLPMGLLPERCLNGKGLVISKTSHGWIQLPQAKSRRVLSGAVTLGEDGTLNGQLAFDNSGYFGANRRKQYFAKGQEEYLKALNSHQKWQIGKSQFENEKALDVPFKESHELTVNDHMTMAGDMIYLNPHLTWSISENPFKLEKREYPVDFGSPEETIYSIRLTIPEGYVVEELPKSKVLALPNNAARYMYNVGQTGNVINFTSSFVMNKPLYTQEEYPNLREFYNQVVAKQAEQIVLKKK